MKTIKISEDTFSFINKILETRGHNSQNMGGSNEVYQKEIKSINKALKELGADGWENKIINEDN